MNNNIEYRNNRKSNAGFTLIELLATIVILSIITSIVIYFAINIIDNARNKSYTTTKNNVEKVAGNYILEDISDNVWVDLDEDSQYQCVTVQNLIDTGYFKSDVLESQISKDRKLKPTDYIFIEKNKDNQTITKNILLADSEFNGVCEQASGMINMQVDVTGWAKKKNVTIKYSLYNTNSVDNLEKYTYTYQFESTNFSNKFDTDVEYASLEVNKNGIVYAKILDSRNNEVYSSLLVIDKIDNTAPVGVIKSKNLISDKQSVTLQLSDSESGVSAYYFGKSNPQKNSVTWKKITNTNSIDIATTVDSSGVWYLGVKDEAGNYSYVSKAFYKTQLSISNGKVTPSSVITMSGDRFVVPTPTVNEGYVFGGWYKNNSYSGGAITEYAPTGDATLYGKTDMTQYSVYVTYSLNGGTVTSQTSSGMYNWSTNSNGLILLNGSILYNEIGYQKKLSDSGLNNWDNASFLNITKTGHKAVESAEWICLYGECVGKTYSDSYAYSASDFCDASKGDCTVVVGPNWQTNTYTITYMANGGYSSRSTNSSGKSYCTYKPSKENHDVTGTMAVQTCTYGESCTLNANAYNRQCHEFMGWTTYSDTDATDYTNRITGDNDTDAFYTNKDTFVYNIKGNITLYAVWKSNHDFSAIGNQVVRTTNDYAFTCGYFHGGYGAYNRYCTKCQMSAAHYDYCYRPGYSTEDEANHFCSCGASVATMTYDDHGAFNSSGSTLDKIYNTSPYSFGGEVEGKSLAVVGSGNLAALVCGNHTTYKVTLNKQNGTGGTTYVYGVYYRGLFLNLDSAHGTYSKKMTTSSNGITVPTRNGYTFGGYYTGTGGSGTQIINASGKITSKYRSTLYTSDVILYAKWVAK